MNGRVIFTADDFGLDEAVNEAVEIAHCDGVLTSASLMVTAPAAEDAIARARRLPRLKVGLHLVLVQGMPASRAAAPLLRPDGAFLESPAAAGVRYFFQPSARTALAAEIKAQFEAYRRTGLLLDHVDGHTHLHIHPTIFSLVMKIGRDYGMKAMRVPFEHPFASAQAASRGMITRVAASSVFAPWAAYMRAHLRAFGAVANDAIFGLYDTGSMVEDLVLKQLAGARAGDVTEFYFHPATRRTDHLTQKMPSYQQTEELKTLTSPRVRASLDRLGLTATAFSEL